MNSNHLHQTITETLELCLSKMSKKLKRDFDPEDKNSIKLLQQFRSTLSTFHSWVKQVKTMACKAVNHVKEKFQKSNHKKNIANRRDDDINILNQLPLTKERVELMSLLKQPSGFLYNPALASK